MGISSGTNGMMWISGEFGGLGRRGSEIGAPLDPGARGSEELDFVDVGLAREGGKDVVGDAGPVRARDGEEVDVGEGAEGAEVCEGGVEGGEGGGVGEVGRGGGEVYGEVGGCGVVEAERHGECGWVCLYVWTEACGG